MRTRIITAAVLLVTLSVALFRLPKIVMAVLISVMCAVAAYELLYRTKLVHHRRLVAFSMTAAFAVPLWCYFGMSYPWGLLGLLVFTALLFAEMMASHREFPFGETAYCYVAGLLFPWLLASLVRIHNTDLGVFIIPIPFIAAFVSDSGAYFAGRFFGKHKLAPEISPKKTVEGMIGGVLAAIVGMLIYAFVMERGFHLQVNYLYAVIHGLLGSLGAVFGDLCFSVIKRQTGIKDYGNLFPGHGGILDRFDSMMIVGPMIEALQQLLPVVV